MNVAEDTATGNFERVAVADAYTVNNYDVNVANTDETPPGRITDAQVIDIHSGNQTTSFTRIYALTWTATGDDFSIGQGSYYNLYQNDVALKLFSDILKGVHSPTSAETSTLKS